MKGFDLPLREQKRREYCGHHIKGNEGNAGLLIDFLSRIDILKAKVNNVSENEDDQ
jgi:hypothetical protein